MKVAILFLLAVIAAEWVTTYFQPLWGIASHIAILIGVILHSARVGQRLHRELLLSLSLVPLVRILSLSMPLANVPQIWWYPIIYTPLIVASIVVMRILGYGADEVGLNFRRLLVQPAVMLSGIGLGVAEYYILTPEPMVAELTLQSVLLPALILIVFTGFAEEFMFRGVLQRSAGQALGTWWGIIYVSVLFAILHMGFLSWFDVVFVFLVALFFSWLVKKTGSLFGVTLAHGITNVMLFLIMPFLA